MRDLEDELTTARRRATFILSEGATWLAGGSEVRRDYMSAIVRDSFAVEGERFREEFADGLFEMHEEGDRDATAVLVAFSVAAIRAGRPLPPRLAEFAARRLSESAAPTKPSLWSRDLVIWTAVVAVTFDTSIRPTRNEATSNWPSGCSIVAEILGLPESLVVKIWQRARKKTLGGLGPRALLDKRAADPVQ